jgi:hypothetical protein
MHNMIFACIVYRSFCIGNNSKVSSAIWKKNIHAWVFQRLQIALVLWTRAILIVYEKLTRACFFPNCTRNHTIITYTKRSICNACKYLIIQTTTSILDTTAADWERYNYSCTWKIQAEFRCFEPRTSVATNFPTKRWLKFCLYFCQEVVSP